jgi:predicted metal-dependent hydrolase
MKIRRSKRKTFEIRILPDGEVELRVPLRTTQAQIDKILKDRAAWIQEKQALARSRPPSGRTYAPGETFLYLGQAYPLAYLSQAGPAFFQEDRFLLSEADRPKAAAVFEAWYRRQARQVLSERVAHHAARFGLQPGPLRINAAKTRWGSCGAGGSLNFTWRLVMAPLAVIDYVVIHELAHLKERNHSPRFWAEVERMLPGYRHPQAWLKQHGHTLRLD